MQLSWGFAGDDEEHLPPLERDILVKFGDRGVDRFATGVMSNVYRVASLLRNHMEREVLGECQLSFTAFIVLFTLLTWGEMEANRLASRAGVTKGTLTGVVSTLERRGLCKRTVHSSDKRKVLVSLTDDGTKLIEMIAPQYNKEEARLVSDLTLDQKVETGNALRTILATGVKLRSSREGTVE